ncbi:alpha/beta hydrolase fold domain-containing protein [Legionella sp.]|uniref:flavin-containing monooxygenase n=1 Tax=Legionella sp. TaxID=459 RepID=UPI000CCAD923|nr:alpha/beta hydrolase fold domain-containing protein [Legionella sp.]PJE18217.1 MAG: steroid monooxygenase [Legionella sp.]
MSANPSKINCDKNPQLDVAIIGAGFSGLYLLHLLRSKGFSAKIFELEDDIGGTWYRNRYPGARCDIPSTDYSYSFDPELEAEWKWTEKFAKQAEIYNYLQYVADKYKLRSDINLSTRVASAKWDEDLSLWHLSIESTLNSTKEITCRFFVMASGCLSIPKEIDIPGTNNFNGESYRTTNWPQEEVSFQGKRVAVIGTGSTGIQIIPVIAAQAASLTVFQRTPCFSLPVNNSPIQPEELKTLESQRKEYREAARWSGIGVPVAINNKSALQTSEKERNVLYEHLWENSGIAEAASVFNDLGTNRDANETLAEFIRNKIRSTVTDSKIAEMLCPKDYAVFTKRLCFDINYYQTYNFPHVRLVDLRQNPITSITKTGINTAEESFDFDVLIYAVGFDAITGALLNVDIIGRDSVQLRDKWSTGPQSYLGLMISGFPNLFTVTGPGSPSVTTNMVMSIEQHVDWISDCIQYMSAQGLTIIEPSETAETSWTQHVQDWGNLTLFPDAESWYTGANISGKPRGFMPYIGGLGSYRAVCNEVRDRDYLGFSFKGPGIDRCNDGIIRPLKPDVASILQPSKDNKNPRPETLPLEEIRALYASFSVEPPPNYKAIEIINDVFPRADGNLSYRLYRPMTPGPHPIIVYFHGGGWALGNLDSDDPICRDLCTRSNSMVISVDYRLAPEYSFPTASIDGYSAVQWVAKNSARLDAIPDKLVVAGWSAGANIAAVVCHMARDLGGPIICGQLLINPMTDCDFSRPSYTNHGEEYLLTSSLIQWFWDQYAKPEDRENPKASPIRAKNLSNLPPAFIATSEFDPLLDEGEAYAKKLHSAGTRVTYRMYPGQIHGSLVAVYSVPSSSEARSDMATALLEFFNSSDTSRGKAVDMASNQYAEYMETLTE